MVRLFVAFALLASAAAPAFACEWKSAADSNDTAQTATESQHGTSQGRS
jgi:hypothetical protein